MVTGMEVRVGSAPRTAMKLPQMRPATSIAMSKHARPFHWPRLGPGGVAVDEVDSRIGGIISRMTLSPEASIRTASSHGGEDPRPERLTQSRSR